MKRSPVFVAMLLVTTLLRAQDLTNYEKLLFPAFSAKPVTGVGGSRFETLIRGYTEVDTPYYAGVPIGAPTSSPSFMTQEAFNPIFTPLNYGPAAPAGRFLYIARDRLPDLSIQYFLASSDPTSAASPHLTALPVIRTPLTAVSRILGIPVEPIIEYPSGPAGHLAGYVRRSTLRVYDFDGTSSGEVSVERFVEGFFGRAGTLGKTTLKLDKRLGDDPTFPYYGQLDLNECLPFSLHTPCLAYSMRIEIVPTSPRLRYWGFVTATDNRTAAVTVFAPQPSREQ